MILTTALQPRKRPLLQALRAGGMGGGGTGIQASCLPSTSLAPATPPEASAPPPPGLGSE